ncbi:50S ribosome-binding GTPase, partial [Buchnera aphidicola]|nr:50S ribosome-binding GTPase [Buchnera aphidicola]
NKNSIKIAIVGKANVGKSTLINSLLKQDRMITLNQPGTTIDSISIPLIHNNKNYILIDTAGTAKKNNYHNKIQQFSVIKTLQSIEKSDVSLLIIDA